MKKSIICATFVFISIFVIMMFLINSNISEAATTYTYIFNDVTYDYSEVPEILRQINLKRQENGLSNIVIDKDLLEIAKTRLQDNLVYMNESDPIRPNGEKISDFYQSMGIENPREKFCGLGNNQREPEYQYYYINQMINLFTGSNSDVTRLGICPAWIQGRYQIEFIFLSGNANEKKEEQIKITNIKKDLVYLDYKESKYRNTITEYTGNTHQIPLYTRIKTSGGATGMGYKLDESCYNQFAWMSYDTSVAEVSQTGLVTFKDKTGPVTIITNYPQRSYDEIYTKAQFQVNRNYSLKNITMSKTNVDLLKGEYENLYVTYNPEDTTDDKTITWTSSNPDVASVSEFGFVRALSQGTTIITAETSNGIKDTCTVNVTEIPLEKIIIPKKVYAKLGDYTQYNSREYVESLGNKLDIKLYPENTTQKNINFKINQMTPEEMELYDKSGFGYYVIIPNSDKTNAFLMYTYNLGKATVRAYSVDNPEIYTDFTVEVVNEIPQFQLGDINADGKINARDAKMALQDFTGKIKLTEDQKSRADVNADGKINARDAKLILQFFTGKIKEF